MSSNVETIKDFLVSLGFDVDSAGQAKFEATLKGVTANVLKMGAVVEGAALAVVGFTTQIANGLDKVYWASQRTGASVQGIKEIGYAASQTGASVESALSSIEGLAAFMRSSPGAEGFLNRLGVQTRDASGKMHDTAAIFTGVGQKLSNMPYYRAQQYAQMLGIDEKTLMAMRRGLGQFSADYSLTAKKIGFNSDEAAKKSHVFMTSMSRLTMTLGQAKDKIGSNLAGGLAGSLDSLRKQLLDNWPKIEAVLMKVINGILWAGDAIARVLWRTGQAIDDVITWFNKLDPAGQQLIMLLGAIGVAWRALNIAFAMTPLGMIITAVTALAAALFLLYDDYKTWKEGGKSLIDWDKWKPAIDKAMKAFGEIGDSFVGLFNKAKKLGSKILELGKELLGFINIDTSKFNGEWLFDRIIDSAKSAIKVIGQLVDAMTKIIDGDFAGAWSSIKDAAVTFTQAPAVQFATDTLGGIWDKGTELLGGTEGAGSVKPPRASAQGEVLLGWMGPMFSQLEALYKLPAGLLKSVAITESGGNPLARSRVGAKGLFQFMDDTAKEMGLRDNEAFDPEKSAHAAAKYLSQLLKMNGGDLNKALASYNWGIGNVQRHGMDLMPRETRNYIPKVLSNMPSARGSQIQQETNIHIHGVSDPREAAQLTADRQKDVNAQMAQQLPGVPG